MGTVIMEADPIDPDVSYARSVHTRKHTPTHPQTVAPR